MKVTFVSNYINHHQIPLANELYAELSEDYHFIQTEPMEEERVKMGWQEEVRSLPYLLYYYENQKLCKEMILESDVVVFGGVEDESYIKQRLAEKKFTIRYFERIYKTGQWRMISPRGLVKKYHDHVKYRNQDVYLLCAGGYVADDFRLIGAYPKKMMKWGYFVEKYHYDLTKLFEKKEKNPRPVILWTGRMIGWKHPEYAVYAAADLKKAGKEFCLKFVGEGEKKEELIRLVKEKNLEENVEFMDFMRPAMVRREMEMADILLMTSDRMEGWGAVVNEGMNSGCVVIGSHMVGAVPYLIKHEKNGLIFKSGNLSSLTEEIFKVIDNKERRKQLGIVAYETIDSLWNPKAASQRFLEFCKNKKTDNYPTGPCSEAVPVREWKMYKKLVKR